MAIKKEKSLDGLKIPTNKDMFLCTGVVECEREAYDEK